MLSVDQALEDILNNICVLDEIERPLLDCLGQIAIEDVYAGVNVPDWDSSAVDGFAVRSEDLKSASPRNPRILHVIETVKAGVIPRQSVVGGTAIRIMTGAIMPSGADCVVKFEDTDEEMRRKSISSRILKKIGIKQEEKKGVNVRKAGENVAGGSLVVAKGTAIGPAEVGVLASLGHARLKVTRRPAVAIITTGEELVKPGKPLRSPQLYNSNAFSTAAQVYCCGGIPQIVGIARDNRSSIISKIRRGMGADMIITSGGVSSGDYDLVKDIQAELGEIIFSQVNMVPGKAFSFSLIPQKGPTGEARNIPHFALPGNPPAGMIAFEVFVRPAISRMLGSVTLSLQAVEAFMEDSLDNQNGARRFAWVNLDKHHDDYYARITRSQVRGVLNSIVLADGLAVVPEKTRYVQKGDTVHVMLLDWH